jgi:uncharacterized membrane protein
VISVWTWLAHALVILCCVAGFIASRAMHAKAEADRRGELHEQSVVQSPRARLFGGVDTAAIGLAYYPAVALASLFFSDRLIRIATLTAATAALAVSLYLLYSLLFITRRTCTNCMLAHVANALIAVSLAALAATT